MRNWFHIQGEEIVDVEAIAQEQRGQQTKAVIESDEAQPTRWENGKRVDTSANLSRDDERSLVRRDRTGSVQDGSQRQADSFDLYKLTLHGNEKIEIKREDLKLGGLAAKRNADWDKAVIKGDYLLKAYDIESDEHILRVYDGPTFKSLFRQSFN